MRVFTLHLFLLCVFFTAPLLANTIIHSEDFDNCSSISWTTVRGSSDTESFDQWNCTTYNGRTYMEFYDNDGNNDEDWLISPSVNLNNTSIDYLSFEYDNHTDAVGLSFFYSTNYDGSGTASSVDNATWVEIPIDLFNIDADAYLYNFLFHPSIDVSSISGSSVYFAFRYISPGNGTQGWSIDNVTISGDYYSTIEPLVATGMKCNELLKELHEHINDHNSITYSGTEFDVWDSQYTTDRRWNDAGTAQIVYDMYSDNPSGPEPYEFTHGADKDPGGNSVAEGIYYNREHIFPKSWWGGGTTSLDTQHTDIHYVIPSDKYVNYKKWNYPLGNNDAGGSSSYTTENGGQIGDCTHPDFSGAVFEPIDYYKGDYARMYLYFAIRYNHEIAGWASNYPEALSGDSYTCFEPWLLQTLLEWHESDPVSTKELDRNNAIFSIQGNRNPLIDHPEYVSYIWGTSDNVACPSCTVSCGLFVDASATGNNDGSSWANAFTDLQDALAIGMGETIHIAEGTYKPTSGTSRGISFDVPSDAILLGGYPAGGGVREPNTYSTILSGEVDNMAGHDGNSFRVVKLANVSNVVLDGLTISDGSANQAATFARARGGGVYSTGSTSTFINVIFSNNFAIYGGGIFAYLSPNVTFEDCTFELNTANYGAAIYHSNETQMYIKRSRIIDNNSLVRCAIEINNSLYTYIENSLIANNISKNANAIGTIATNRDQTLDVINTTILGEAKDRYLVTMQVGFGDQLDANFRNCIVAHQNISYLKSFKDYNNGIINLLTEHCYVQGSSVLGTTINNLYSDTAGDLMLNADYSVNECSPVVNNGSDPAAVGPIDINGNNRFFNTVDIGAFEVQTNCSPARENNSTLGESLISVYPNPTKGIINISSLNENQEIHIYNTLGKLVLSKSANQSYLDISDFSTGIYLLHIKENKNIIHIQKIIKN